MANNRYRVALFDLDGTLVNTTPLIVASFQHTFKEKLGLEVTAQELYPYFGEPLVTTMARYAPDRAAEFVEFYRTFNLTNHDRLVEEFAGVRDAVVALHEAGVKLAVVTSKMSPTAKRALDLFDMASYFEIVVGIGETTKHKPDPEPALLALQLLGEQPGDHVLMIGDSRFDIGCGHNAGIKAAAVAWTVQQREELAAAQPDHWIEQPADLVPLITGR